MYSLLLTVCIHACYLNQGELREARAAAMAGGQPGTPLMMGGGTAATGSMAGKWYRRPLFFTRLPVSWMAALPLMMGGGTAATGSMAGKSENPSSFLFEDVHPNWIRGKYRVYIL